MGDACTSQHREVQRSVAFTAKNVNYVKVQIMLIEKIVFKREKIFVNYEAAKFIN